MYYLKNTLFLELTKNQKSSLFSFLKSFVKKHPDKDTDEIINALIEDETYYFEQKNPHFEWIISKFENEKFLDELKKYVNECKKQIVIKEAQKPYLLKQKEEMKLQKKKIQEYQMSKQEPTKKQLYYYEQLCKRHHVQKVDTEGLSRLDLKNMIGKILDDAVSQKTI